MDGAVSESTYLTSGGVGRAEPSFNARAMHNTDRAATLARRQQSFTGTCVVADTTDRTARNTAHTTTFPFTSLLHFIVSNHDNDIFQYLFSTMLATIAVI